MALADGRSGAAPPDDPRVPVPAPDPAQPAGAVATVHRLRDTFAGGRTRDLSWRQAQLDGVMALIDGHEDRLVAALEADLGKPGLDGWASDLAPPRLEARHARSRLSRWARPRKVKLPLAQRPGRAWSVPEPKGVVLVIAPWNYPVQLSLSPLVSALAAGNTVVLKPSELAPATSAALAELIPMHLDTDAVAVVEGGADQTTELLDEPFDHIFFTGSGRVGRIVMEAAARHLTPVTLELGGKSPAIVAADADLEVSARRIAWAKHLNAGQTCIAPDYVLVERAIRDDFVDRVVEELTRFRDTAPTARILNAGHRRRLRGLLADHGGTVALAGRDEGEHVDPAVVVDPDVDAPMMREEIFGPVLPVITVDSLDDATRFVNERPKPLALYLFSASTDTEARVLEATSSGGVCVNHAVYQALVPDLPFGGVGASGMGAYHGEVGFETFSHRKGVLRKPARPDPSLMYPPYGRLTERLLRRLLR